MEMLICHFNLFCNCVVLLQDIFLKHFITLIVSQLTATKTWMVVLQRRETGVTAIGFVQCSIKTKRNTVDSCSAENMPPYKMFLPIPCSMSKFILYLSKHITWHCVIKSNYLKTLWNQINYFILCKYCSIYLNPWPCYLI